MQDNLKKFVNEHKDEFDSITPKDLVWEGINSKLEASKVSASKIIFWRSAAILLFICSIGLTFYANKDSALVANKRVVYDNDFLTTEKYYASVIQEREALVIMVASTYPEIKNEFELDWNILDKSYANLKEEYAKNQSSEVLNALVQNLQSRVNLLNKQINILKQIDSKKPTVVEI